MQPLGVGAARIAPQGFWVLQESGDPEDLQGKLKLLFVLSQSVPQANLTAQHRQQSWVCGDAQEQFHMDLMFH